MPPPLVDEPSKQTRPYAVPEKDIRDVAPSRSKSTTATVREVELILAASAEFERVVRHLPVDSWDLPTPSQMSVRDLVEHVVVGNRFTALLLAGVGREQARNMLTDDQLGDDPVAAVAESWRHQAEAFAAAPPEQPVPGPRGDVPAEAFLRFRLVDLVVHAWDLLRAAGLDETLDPPVVAGLSRVVEPHLDGMLAFGAYGEGPSGTVPPEASQQTRLLDWFGRRP
nr:TIGR03086 family protein [Rhodococcus wratislaviensis]